MKKINGGSRLYVGNIPGTATKQEIVNLFEEYGKIADIDIKYNRNSNGTNYAFIEYESAKAAEETILKKNGLKFKGFMLKVEYSIDKKTKETLVENNRIHYRVVLRNLPIPLKWKSVRDFLCRAGKVVYIHLDNDVGIAEFETKEGMLKAVNTLDRIMYNPTSNLYIRVIRDIPFDDSEMEDTMIDSGVHPSVKGEKVGKGYNYYSSNVSDINNYDLMTDDDPVINHNHINNTSNVNNTVIKKNKMVNSYNVNSNVIYETYENQN